MREVVILGNQYSLPIARRFSSFYDVSFFDPYFEAFPSERYFLGFGFDYKLIKRIFSFKEDSFYFVADVGILDKSNLPRNLFGLVYLEDLEIDRVFAKHKITSFNDSYFKVPEFTGPLHFRDKSEMRDYLMSFLKTEGDKVVIKTNLNVRGISETAILNEASVLNFVYSLNIPEYFLSQVPFVLEEYREGKEFSLDFYVFRGEVYDYGFLTFESEYGSLGVYIKLPERFKRLVDYLLGDSRLSGILFLTFIYDERENSCYFLEAGVRPPYPFIYGHIFSILNWPEFIVKNSLGEKVDPELLTEGVLVIGLFSQNLWGEGFNKWKVIDFKKLDQFTSLFEASCCLLDDKVIFLPFERRPLSVVLSLYKESDGKFSVSEGFVERYLSSLDIPWISFDISWISEGVETVNYILDKFKEVS